MSHPNNMNNRSLFQFWPSPCHRRTGSGSLNGRHGGNSTAGCATGVGVVGHHLYHQPLSRIRLALYFTCILAITTSLYCLLQFKPDGLKSTAFDSNHHLKFLTSSQEILDEVIQNANKFYLDFFRYNQRQKPVPPDLVPASDSPDELSKLIYMIDNLTESTQNYEPYSGDYRTGKPLQERGNLEYVDEDFDGDPQSVNYQLRALGFDLRHVIHQYVLSHPDNVSSSNESFRSTLYTANKARFHQRYEPNQLLTNLSSILPREFLSVIIFVTAFGPNQFHLGTDFIKSFESFRDYVHDTSKSPTPPLVLMVYDLGLSEAQLNKVEELCNRTRTDVSKKLCEMRKFQYEMYTSHVSDLRMAAYRSIIIQEMLRDIKLTNQWVQRKSKTEAHPMEDVTLFWLDPHYRLINSKYHLLFRLQNETRQESGILSWPIEQPTSALTHPRMFEYFRTTKENFYFHRMIRPGHLLIAVNERTWRPFQWGIMLPWVRCALTSDCIAPLGSQWRSSCRLDKKPHYRYSGCHHYDMSALNVVLGIAFNYSSSQYSAHLSRRFFTPFNKEPPVSADPPENDLAFGSYEYQFEEQESKVPGRFDLVPNDYDFPDEMTPSAASSSSFLFPFSSSASSSVNHHQNHGHDNSPGE